MVAAAISVVSCSKDKDTADLISPVEGSIVTISLTDGDSTRAFFDATAAAESWEKSVSSATIFAFDDAGALLLRRGFSSSELTNSSATFALPGVVANDKVDIFVVANNDIPTSVTNYDTLKAIANSNLNDYNGEFSTVSTGAKRSEGFVMTAVSNVTISEGKTAIAATLERTVAKVAVELTQSADFASNYSGTLKVKDVVVSNTPSTTTLASSFGANSSKNYTFTQNTNISGDKSQNLFYIYDSETPSSDDDKVLLTVNAIYDIDGDLSSTGDQSDVSYSILLEDGSAITKVTRNNYYRISGTISGLEGADAEISISVSDWASATDSSVELGN